MGAYSSDNPPSYVDWFLNQFPQAELKSIGATNGSWWQVQQGDVAIHIEQNFSDLRLQLKGTPMRGSSSAVQSKAEVIRVNRPTKGDTAEIHDAYRDALETFASNGETLYDAFVNTFGEEAITMDNRSD